MLWASASSAPAPEHHGEADYQHAEAEDQIEQLHDPTGHEGAADALLVRADDKDETGSLGGEDETGSNEDQDGSNDQVHDGGSSLCLLPSIQEPKSLSDLGQ
jgi:hypothetical protein